MGWKFLNPSRAPPPKLFQIPPPPPPPPTFPALKLGHCIVVLKG